MFALYKLPAGLSLNMKLYIEKNCSLLLEDKVSATVTDYFAFIFCIKSRLNTPDCMHSDAWPSQMQWFITISRNIIMGYFHRNVCVCATLIISTQFTVRNVYPHLDFRLDSSDNRFWNRNDAGHRQQVNKNPKHSFKSQHMHMQPKNEDSLRKAPRPTHAFTPETLYLLI